MLMKLRSRLTYANVMATLAAPELFARSKSRLLRER
jgi:hypothetical protein